MKENKTEIQRNMQNAQKPSDLLLFALVRGIVISSAEKYYSHSIPSIEKLEAIAFDVVEELKKEIENDNFFKRRYEKMEREKDKFFFSPERKEEREFVEMDEALYFRKLMAGYFGKIK